MNKAELIEALQNERHCFENLLEELTDETLELPGVIDEWSVKDLLAHITMWEAELVKLLWQAKQGRRPTTVHFQAATVDERNAKWYQQNKERPLEAVLNDYESVRRQTIRRVKDLSESELTDSQRFPWLDDQPLWHWIAEDSYKHEAEHREQIQNWWKNRTGASSQGGKRNP